MNQEKIEKTLVSVFQTTPKKSKEEKKQLSSSSTNKNLRRWLRRGAFTGTISCVHSYLPEMLPNQHGLEEIGCSSGSGDLPFERYGKGIQPK